MNYPASLTGRDKLRMKRNIVGIDERMQMFILNNFLTIPYLVGLIKERFLKSGVEMKCSLFSK